jgi:hypothetical protein
VGGSDGAVAAIAIEEADDGIGNSDNANDSSAQDAEGRKDESENFDDGDEDDSDDGGVKVSNDDVDRSPGGNGIATTMPMPVPTLPHSHRPWQSSHPLRRRGPRGSGHRL